MKLDAFPLMFIASWAVFSLVSASGCDRVPETGDETSVADARESVSASDHSEESKGGSTNSDDVELATATFHEMDERTPLPLTPMMANHQRQNMRNHLVTVRNIVGAAARKDFDGVRSAAQNIASSPQTRQMCNHMGAGAEGFAEKAIGFHETADGIVEAAEGEDLEGVMSALDETLETCTSCHADYKQKIVTDEVWERATEMAPPGGGGEPMHRRDDR